MMFEGRGKDENYGRGGRIGKGIYNKLNTDELTR